jgi:membrane peptidoglycan carboxypeptidase
MSRWRWRSPRSSSSVATPEVAALRRRGLGGAFGRRPRWQRRVLATLLAFVVVATLLAAAAGAYLLTLPGVGDAEARVAAILARHGGRASSLPPPRRLGQAIVAAEDGNFYENAFVNVAAGAGRAAIAAIESGEDPAGSTIPQQLAKTLYPHGGGVLGELEQIGLGVKLSLDYSHERVLSMYLNAIYYGNGYWGDAAAARGYFGVSPRRLTWGQAALLAGLPQAPSAYDPESHLVLARDRQRYVLDQLVADGRLSAAAATRALGEPLNLRVPPELRRLSDSR